MATTVVRNEKRLNPALNIFVQFLRIAVGALFIFSGVVKANDPMGLANKMTEFFEVFAKDFKEHHMLWGYHWMMSMIPHALSFSVLMIGFEIIAGVALLLGFAFRFFSFFLLLLNIFFTFLTAYVYYWDIIMHSAKVRECGCFGDCIKITNSQTFWKDVILLAAAIILFLARKHIKPLLPKYPNTAIFILAVFFAFGAQWWVLEHLPVHDCMPYKIGNNIWQKSQLPANATPAVYKTTLFYKKNGEVKAFPMENYPWDDSTWTYVDTKTVLIKEASGVPEIKDFKVADFGGNDYTEAMLKEPGFAFLLFLKSPENARTDNMDVLQGLLKDAQARHVPFYVLSSADSASTNAWKAKWKLQAAEFYTLDGTANKTALRTDPGLLLIEQGTIRGKWSFRDYPRTVEAAKKH